MIRFDDVSFRYPDVERPTLAAVHLDVPEGELALVVGPTGAGKSTLLRATNGLVPYFSGGTLGGRVRVQGRDTRDHPPRELADVVGYVGQVPADGFVADVVEHELAFAMENLGVAPDAMRRRIEDVLDLFGLHGVRQRPLDSLSGGQQQRVAIAAALTASPRVLVLDEPTSALDPAAAEDVFAALARLVHDLGVTVVAAEHRLERVVHLADVVVAVTPHGAVTSGDPGPMLSGSSTAPPIIRLGDVAGWDDHPRSVRDARRAAGELRARLDRTEATPALREARAAGEVVVAVRGATCSYGPIAALRGVDLDVREGEVLALMGRNGSGKSTLLGAVAGLRPLSGGQLSVSGGAARLVPQNAGAVLFEATVEAECSAADHDAGLSSGRTAALLDELLPAAGPDARELAGRHPRDLSEGQRVAVALAVMLVAEPAVLLLDEPTRGLDYEAKAHLVGVLDRLAAQGRAVVVATHDVEFVAELADRVAVLADGEVVADGPAREVVAHSPVFAPQVAKILAPGPWLTVAEVARTLERVPA